MAIERRGGGPQFKFQVPIGVNFNLKFKFKLKLGGRGGELRLASENLNLKTRKLPVNLKRRLPVGKCSAAHWQALRLQLKPELQINLKMIASEA